jgi:hypothetical protein
MFSTCNIYSLLTYPTSNQIDEILTCEIDEQMVPAEVILQLNADLKPSLVGVAVKLVQQLL